MNSLDPLFLVAVFLLGASTGWLITSLQFRKEIENLRAKLEMLSQDTHPSTAEDQCPKATR